MIKMHYKAELNVDLSFAVLSNKDLFPGLPLQQYLPLDEQTKEIISAVVVCQRIKELVIQSSTLMLNYEIYS